MCKELNCLCPSDDCGCDSCKSDTICCECESECGEDYRIRNGSIFCSECDPKVECAACGDLVNRDDAIIYEGDPHCEDCVFCCEECGDTTLTSEQHSARKSGSRNWKDLCPSCYEDTFECDCCHDTIIGDAQEVDNGDAVVCSRCADNYYRWCDRCDTMHHEDHHCFSIPEERSHSTAPRIGIKTHRFTLRTVGVEIETGTGATDPEFAEDFESKFRPWGYKGDGSLDCGAMELVSPPLAGDKIASELRGVYRLLNYHGVNMDDEAAGCHIHVDYKDIRDRLVSADMKGDQRPGDIFVRWGDNMTTVTRLLVSHGRAHHNTYCSAGFGTRAEYEVSHVIRKKLTETGYAAVAVRSRTIEFRIWEVTDSAEVTMARAEFSQKAVDYLHKILTQPTKRGSEKLLKRFNKACASFRVGHFTQLRRVLGLSEECSETLRDIFNRRVSESFNENFIYRRYAFY